MQTTSAEERKPHTFQSVASTLKCKNPSSFDIYHVQRSINIKLIAVYSIYEYMLFLINIYRTCGYQKSCMSYVHNYYVYIFIIFDHL